MVVTDPLIIHKTSIHLHRLIHKCASKLSVRTDSAGLQSFLNSRNNVLSNVSGIGSGICEYFVIFVKALHNIQGLFCRKTIFQVGFPLQSCQVVQARGHSLFCFFLYTGYFKSSVLQPAFDLLCPFPRKSTEALCFLISPGPFHILGLQRNTIIFFWHKFADFFFALCDHGKGGGLHPATGKLGVVFTGESSGTIHSHQPVCFCPCNSCTVKIIIVMPVFQIGKAFFNCFICD